ncbi:conserved hypothetical protein, partial [Ricinus communis]
HLPRLAAPPRARAVRDGGAAMYLIVGPRPRSWHSTARRWLSSIVLAEVTAPRVTYVEWLVPHGFLQSREGRCLSLLPRLPCSWMLLLLAAAA